MISLWVPTGDGFVKKIKTVIMSHLQGDILYLLWRMAWVDMLPAR